MTDIVRKIDGAPASGPRPAAAARPDNLDRDIRIRVSASTADGQKKTADVWSETAGGQRASSRWRIECDEGPRLGGGDSAPSPLAYFSAGVAF